MPEIDDQIAILDQEIQDMEQAESRAREQGLSLGQYDLQAASAARRRDRQKEETIRQVTAGGIEITNEIEESVLPTENPYIKPEAYERAITPEDRFQEYTPKEDYVYDIDKHPEYLDKLSQYQDKLTQALIEDNPEFKGYYEKGKKLDVKGRDELISEMQEKGVDVSLSPERQKEVLGEEGLKDYRDLKYVLTFSGKEKYGTTTVGKKEKAGDPLEKYGVRSALLYRYEGEPRTAKEAFESAEYLRKKR